MKKLNLLSACLTAAFCFGSIVTPASAQLFGLWEFDDPANLGKATVGTDLTIEGTAPTYSASLADDNATSLSGAITTAAPEIANRIFATHGIEPNGGNIFGVAQYSMVMDIFSPAGSRDQWRSIFQTNTSNTDDGDYFIRNSDNRIGVGSATYSTDPMDVTVWTRVVFTVDLTLEGDDMTVYFNGAPYYVYPNDQAIDSRFALEASGVYFFTDENGENFPMNVGTLAIYDRALTASEAAALGGPGAPVSIEVVGVPGDANGDGNFDFGDIEAFFLALTDSAAYAIQYPNVLISLLDMNSDGNTDFGDIDAFFTALTAG